MSSRSSTPIPVIKSARTLDKFPDDVRKEVQRFIAVAAFETIKDKDKNVKVQEKDIETKFHGRGDVVGQVWKFMLLVRLGGKSRLRSRSIRYRLLIDELSISYNIA